MTGNIDRGIIYVYQELLQPPEWVSYLNTLSVKKKIKISPTKYNKAVVFFTLKGPPKKTFAIAFGNGHTLLNPEQITPDFGLKISKSLLEIHQIISIDSTSIDRKIYNTRKQSNQFLMPEKFLEYGTQNIVKSVNGIYEEFNRKFSLAGRDSLSFKGEIDLLNDLEEWLSKFAALYDQDQNNLDIFDDLQIANKKLQEILDRKLGQKILDIINTDPITKRQTSSIRIFPNEVFDLDHFNGFFINGLGYKSSTIDSDFIIDELNYFNRFKQRLKTHKINIEGILEKIKTDTILKKDIRYPQLEPVCTVYKAINFEVKYGSNKYILITGKWYQIDRNFYENLKRDIDAISKPNTSIKFIKFDKTKHKRRNNQGGYSLSEGAYNEDLAEQSKVLLLDRKNYNLDNATKRKFGFKNSPIEICDILYYTSSKIQFIHVKRHSGASGTSHLLTQGIVSAHAFINDNKSVLDHINNEIDKHNKKKKRTYSLLKLNYSDKKKEVILAIIDERKNIKKPNSALLTILEMISMRENIRNLNHLGFECYLEFIPSN